MAKFLPALAAVLMLAQTSAQAQQITRPATQPAPTAIAVPRAEPPAIPQAPVPQPQHRSIQLESGSGQVLALGAPVASLFAADPKIAEVRPASPSSLFVFGVAPGRTTIAALDAAGHPIAEYDVTVRPSAFGAAEAQQAIYRLMPGRGVQVRQSASGLVLTGAVATPAEAERAVAIARGYLSANQKLDNRLTVLSAIQVNLRVRVAEMSRAITRELGVNWQALGNIGKYSINFLTNNPLAASSHLGGLPRRQLSQQRRRCEHDHRRVGAG